MILTLGVLVLLTAFAVATARLFVWPTRDRPERVDAIIMLAGDGTPERLDHAVALARQGYAPVLALSDPGYSQPCAPAVPGVRLICFDPTPRTTRGEARATARLAARYHWRSIMVVSGRAQDTRARIRMRRCFQGRIMISPTNPPRHSWPYLIAYEWGALVKALTWQRGC
ncbi:MAG: ElyC/SanA/YdcF family protein [Frankia sp.]